MYTHILISTDGSEFAQKGVDHGLTLAKALGSKVTVITATAPFPIIYGREWQPTPDLARQFEEENEIAAKEILAKIEADAEKLGLAIETVHVSEASAAYAIVETAKRYDCNLIVMASHGRSGIRKLFLGSQASKVVTDSTIPVLIVR